MKKFRIVAGGLLAALAAIWLVGGAAVRDLPPPDVADFQGEAAVPAPEDNAYTYFAAATNALYFPEESGAVADFLADRAAAGAEIRELVARNAECFAQLALGAEQAVCRVPPIRDFRTLIPYINPWLKIGKGLAVQARLARQEGRPGEAVAACRLALRFGDRVQRDAPCILNYLVGVALMGMSFGPALELAWDPATPPEDLARLAEAFAEPGPLAPGLVGALKGEYLTAANEIGRWRAGPGGAEAAGLLDGGSDDEPAVLKRLRRSAYGFQPNRTKRMLAEWYRGMIRDAPRVYADTARRPEMEDPRRPWGWVWPNATGREMLEVLMPATDRLLEKKCQMEAGLAGVRLVVACHRFARARGRWPAGLEELVPDYLPAVPRDPYDGAPFRHSPEKGVVYSIGRDLQDGGGAPGTGAGAAAGAAWTRRLWEGPDIVFELGGAAPAGARE